MRYHLAHAAKSFIVGHHAVASVGTTHAVVEVPARVPAPGDHARSKTENGTAATLVRDAVLQILIFWRVAPR